MLVKKMIQTAINSKLHARVTKALIRGAVIHEKSEKYRRDVINAIRSYEFESSELKNVFGFDNWNDLLRASVAAVDKSLPVWVELGVMTGNSSRAIAAEGKRQGYQLELHGFDSFKGLPEDWHARAKKGAFAIKTPEFSEKNIFLHVGLFDETLPAFASGNKGQVGFLHVDSDLYSSAKCGFKNLNLGPGTVILFDEYWNYPEFMDHEIKAFREFIAASRLGFEYIGYNKNHMQLAVVLRVGAA